MVYQREGAQTSFGLINLVNYTEQALSYALYNFLEISDFLLENPFFDSQVKLDNFRNPLDQISILLSTKLKIGLNISSVNTVINALNKPPNVGL